MVFVGLQASGKSTFYQQRFFKTHVRINLDMLKTRHRETLLLRACIEMKQPFVVDNTNPTVVERAKYIGAARAAGFHVIGYYFQTNVGECITRNNQRDVRERVPAKGIAGTAKRLVVPALAEGFETLYYVNSIPGRTFRVTEWLGRPPSTANGLALSEDDDTRSS